MCSLIQHAAAKYTLKHFGEQSYDLNFHLGYPRRLDHQGLRVLRELFVIDRWFHPLQWTLLQQ